MKRNPAALRTWMLRLRELETLRELAKVANARIYIGFDKHVRVDRHDAEVDGC